MTLNGHFEPWLKIHAFSEPTSKISMTTDANYQQQRCSAMILVSGNIKFMRIFAGVPWRWGVKRQCGNQKRRFNFRAFGGYVFGTLGNEANIIIYYYLGPSPLSPFHWPQNTWPRMTLNGHFTLNFHCYEQRFQNLFYILTVEPIYRIFLSYHVTSRDVRKRIVIRRIFGIRGRIADLS